MRFLLLDCFHVARQVRRAAPVLVALTLAWPAAAQEIRPPQNPDRAIEELNALVGSAPEDERAEDVMLPAIAEMDAPPAALRGQYASALITPANSQWNVVQQWALAAPQQGALDALREVADPDARFVFTLPYGDAAPERFREASLYSDLGPQNLLVAANHLHLDGFTDVGRLVHVEATRLADAGEMQSACELLLSWVRFGRMIADREYQEEKMWAMRTMNLALVRVRDLLYAWPDQLMSPDAYRDLVESLDDREVEIGRIRLPRADRWAALQLIGRVMEERGGPDPQAFGPTMGRLAAEGRPLKLFGQAGRWQRMAENHADWFDTLDTLSGVLKDRELRWGLSAHDPVLQTKSEYDRLDAARHALLLRAIDDPSMMLGERLILRTELEGTRVALAIVGYRSRFRSWPPTLFAVRGGARGFIRDLGPDPFIPIEDAERSTIIGVERDPLEFFVPIRDTRRSEREDPEPIQITVNLGELASLVTMFADAEAFGELGDGAEQGDGEDGEESAKGGEQTDAEGDEDSAGSSGGAATALSFIASLSDDTFVLYSVGEDGEDDRATSVGVGGEDYLLFPPLIGLIRDQMEF